MSYLLDTHVFVWFAGDRAELPEEIRRIIAAPGNEIKISIASFWEIAIKKGIGKLALSSSTTELAERAEAENIEIVPIAIPAIERISVMPFHHKDPFDRIIAATALTTGDVLLSIDPVFDAYGVSRTWK
jgi:PIN domain nuclease of toxin-antitoxin system